MLDLDINELLTRCIEEVNNIPPGTTFTVPDLFKGYVWSNLKINKGQLGIMFNNEVKIGNLKDKVVDTTKKSQESNVYLDIDKQFEREIYKKI